MGNFLARLICEHITFDCGRLFLAFQKKKLLPLNHTIQRQHQVASKTLVAL